MSLGNHTSFFFDRNLKTSPNNLCAYVEGLLAQRGIAVSYETIRLWCIKFGPEYARRLKRRQGRLGDTWHLDEVFIKIQGKRQYLWRAVVSRW